MFYRAVASSARVQEILDEVPAQKEAEPERGAEEIPASGGIQFRQVSFSYADSARPALQEADFSVRQGEVVGLIGPTGSGKSTLVNLAPRFYDATSGQVLVGGRDNVR